MTIAKRLKFKARVKIEGGLEVEVDMVDIGIPGLGVNQDPRSQRWSITHLRSGYWVAQGFRDMTEATDCAYYAQDVVIGADWTMDLQPALTPIWVEDWRRAAYEGKRVEH